MAEARHNLEFLYDIEKCFWAQRAKLKLLCEHERNTKFFHAAVSRKKTCD